MRIIYICADPGVPIYGRKGCSIHVQEVLRALRRRGAELEVHAARIGGEPPPDLADLPIFRLPIRPGDDSGTRELSSIAANEALRLRLQVRRRLEKREPFQVVYERQSLWSTAGMAFARDAGIPGILEVNAPLVEEQSTHRKLMLRERAREAVKQACDQASCVIAVSEGVAEHVISGGASESRVQVVPNGVDPGRFKPPRSPVGSEKDPFTIGFVGSLKPWHGMSTLVDAFARVHRSHEHCRLLVVGDGPERESLTESLVQRGLSDFVTLTGAVDPADVPGWLHEMDVGVAPYPAMDGFYFSPLKILEYMAAGLPIIASRIGQIPQLLEDGACGLLCDPGEPEALAESLDRLRRDPSLRVRLAHSARTAAVEKHSWDAVVERIFDHAGLGEGLLESTESAESGE
jgi:glycosyltransferase involved in cell wall biosynthesis